VRALVPGLAAFVTLMASARADPPLAGTALAPDLLTVEHQQLMEEAPPPLPLPDGTITLGDRMHLVPIHLYPMKSGAIDTFTVELDGLHGARGLRLEIGGTGVIGGVAGELQLGRFGKLRSTVLSTPNLTLIDVDDTIVLYHRDLPGNRSFSAGLRAGMKLMNVPNLIVAQGYLQAAARVDGLFPQNRLVHLDLYAGSGGMLNYNIALDASPPIAPGLELSTALVIER
jgi:hypothetical protein